MTTVVLDFETLSQSDLKLCGAWRYAEDPTTTVLCLSYTIDDAPAERWRPEMPEPQWPLGAVFVAHNAQFEKAIWRYIMVPEFGWKDIPNSQWHDTMAMCAMRAIPQGLDQAVRVLRLPNLKDNDASDMTVKLSRINKKTGAMPIVTPAILERVETYCDDDVYAQRGLHNRLGWLPAGERDVWLLDQRINERGLRLDVPLVRAMQHIVDEASGPLSSEFRTITGGLNMTQVAKVGDWVKQRGVLIPNLQAETLANVLGKSPDMDEDDIDGEIAMPGDVRRALEIRQLIGSAAIKKLKSAEAVVMADGRARGLLAYHGAGPGRWAGRLLQPHNFPRSRLKVDGEAPSIDPLIAALMTEDPEYVECMYGPAVATVVSSLRHIIVASPGRSLVAGDFAGIEARLTLALAGAHSKTSLMASGADVYCDMATQIYKRPINKKNDPEERQIGKNSVLGLGFGMGPDKFHFKYCQNQELSFCEEVVKVYRQEWAPEVPKLWYGLMRAATKAVWDKTRQEYAGIVYQVEDLWLTCRLPSGRKLWYFNPKPTREAMPWDDTDIRQSWTYQAKKNGAWITIRPFGGLLTENVAQAMARDLLTEAMFKCEKNGLPIVLTVHDEIVAEPLEKDSDHKILRAIMIDIPDWARHIGVPVEAECWTGDRYRK